MKFEDAENHPSGAKEAAEKGRLSNDFNDCSLIFP
jgi:hypothetical protein